MGEHRSGSGKGKKWEGKEEECGRGKEGEGG